MNISRKWIAVGFSVACAAGIVACEKPGTGEVVGKKVDETTEKAGDKLDQAAAAGSEKGEQTADFVDDAAITAKVKSAILAETGLRVLQVKVDTVDGVVTLTGTADSQRNIDKAKELASSVAGVKGVENQLALNPTN